MPISDWTLSSVTFDKGEDSVTRGKKVMSLLSSKMSLSLHYEEATSESTLYDAWYISSLDSHIGIRVMIKKNGTIDQISFYSAWKTADGEMRYNSSLILFEQFTISAGGATGVGLRTKQFGNLTVYVPILFNSEEVNYRRNYWTFTSNDYFTGKSVKGVFDGNWIRMTDDETETHYSSSLWVCGGTNFPDTFYLVAAPYVTSNDFFYGQIGDADSLYYINVKSTIGKIIKLGTRVFECLGGNIYCARSD